MGFRHFPGKIVGGIRRESDKDKPHSSFKDWIFSSRALTVALKKKKKKKKRLFT